MDRYEEALERAKKGLPIDEVFPELKESEDEKIRKILIHIVKGACDKYGIKYKGDEITEEKLLAYLEKQKEQKPVDIAPNQFDGITYGMQGYSTEKSAEWSEEDLRHKSWILECLADGERKVPQYAEDFRAAYKWLKSLRPQPHWKPSEEQMDK